MRRPFRFWGLVLAGLAMGMTGVAIRAEATAVRNTGERFVRDVLAQSEVAFVGTVDKIEYALSEPARPGGSRIPHTFVTYRVEKVLAGELPSSFVTLRFIGGLDPVKMRIMSSTRTPQIDLGDRDILFVQGNTSRMCPLVGNLDGRFRIIGGRVYTEEGRSISLAPNGSLRLGPRYRLEDIETTTVCGRTFGTTGFGPKALVPPGDAASEAELISVVQGAARGIETRKAFADADPSVPFAGPTMTAVPPPDAR